jgi:hypothetical protein
MAGDFKTVRGLFKALTTISSSVKIANISSSPVSSACTDECVKFECSRHNNENTIRLNFNIPSYFLEKSLGTLFKPEISCG